MSSFLNWKPFFTFILSDNFFQSLNWRWFQWFLKTNGRTLVDDRKKICTWHLSNCQFQARFFRVIVVLTPNKSHFPATLFFFSSIFLLEATGYKRIQFKLYCPARIQRVQISRERDVRAPMLLLPASVLKTCHYHLSAASFGSIPLKQRVPELKQTFNDS